MQQIIITPKVFFDLFILCLFWQSEDIWQNEYTRLSGGWTTVDKVARILYGLGIITKKQKSLLHKDRRVQTIFFQSTSRFDQGSGAKFLFLHLDHATDINSKRLLRDYRLSLTSGGIRYAKLIIEKYLPLLTKTMYFAEIERQAKPKAIGMVMKNYQQKVEKETKED